MEDTEDTGGRPDHDRDGGATGTPGTAGASPDLAITTAEAARIADVRYADGVPTTGVPIGSIAMRVPSTVPVPEATTLPAGSATA